MEEDAVKHSQARLFGVVMAAVALSACQTVSAPSWAIPPEAATETVNGYPLAYVARGTGPTVVFVHGVLTDYRYWQAPLDSWPTTYRVVAISLRHFYPEGWDGTGTDFTVKQHARDLVSFIERQPGPVHVVGWSYGAHVSYEAARARPELIKKLVLIEPPLDSLVGSQDQASNAVQIERANETARIFSTAGRDAGLNYAIDAINGPGFWQRLPERNKQAIRDNAWTVVGIGRQEPERVTCESFGSLTMPVMLVKGELTTARFQTLVQQESRCLPHAEVVTIPKAGHPSPSMNPAAFKEAVMGFLEK
jgi:pimeloyl-ACP methyl ester carboxylesterase